MYTLNCKGKLLRLDKPVVMGILNFTPDSFYAGSRLASVEQAVRQAEMMLQQGAAILDIGGQSTRPGAGIVGAEAEADRVIMIIEAVIRSFPNTLISIDTFHAVVAAKAIAAGASIINDISGGQLDEEMLPTAGKLQVPYICMHTKGTPATMQGLATYQDVVLEVLDYFIQRTEACRRAGINDVIIDPGFGFAKTITHNFTLLKNLSVLKVLGKPILLGISRKATIYKTLGTTPEEALNGTTVLNTIGLLSGADILRVHDVKEAVEAVKLVREWSIINDDRESSTVNDSK
jgi:dihydropteroate synthase